VKARIAALALVAGVGLGALAVQGLHAQTKPPVFVIFEAEVKDRAAYGPFAQIAVKEMQAQGGKFIVANATPDVLSGNQVSNVI
jgi:hypothetical protein